MAQTTPILDEPIAPQSSWGHRTRVWIQNNPDQFYPWLTLVSLTAVLIWSYWNSLLTTAHTWEDPSYSHGYLVPAFALVLLCMRAKRLQPPTPLATWAGLGLLAAGLTMRVLSTRHGIIVTELVSFVPSLIGLVLLVGGWSMLRWAGPAVGFLIFMFPLPSAATVSILPNLKHLATIASTFSLQTLGIAAYNDGNIITVGETKMGVVDACSGLVMLMNLVAMSVALAMVIPRPWWDRVIILLSAIPVALAVNVMRITSVGIFYSFSDDHALGNAVHGAGWIMMFPALGLFFLELHILSRLVIEEDDEAVSPLLIGPRSLAAR